MKKNGHITSFYIETLMLIIVFIAMILVITQIFGEARLASNRAKILTNAVTLAQNAAESFEAADSPETLQRLLCFDENGVQAGSDLGFPDGPDRPVLSCAFGEDMKPAVGAPYLLQLQWMPEDDGLVRTQISVFYAGQKESVYTLETASSKEVRP